VHRLSHGVYLADVVDEPLNPYCWRLRRDLVSNHVEAVLVEVTENEVSAV
jgi:hypothetical protein